MSKETSQRQLQTPVNTSRGFLRLVGIPSQPFKVMWVVDVSCIYVPGAVIKGGVALGAPHLRAPRNAVDARRALRTRAGGLFDQRGGLNVFRFARVRFVLYFVTGFANRHIAQPAFNVGSDKPFAVPVGALQYVFRHVSLVSIGRTRARGVRVCGSQFVELYLQLGKFLRVSRVGGGGKVVNGLQFLRRLLFELVVDLEKRS